MQHKHSRSGSAINPETDAIFTIQPFIFDSHHRLATSLERINGATKFTSITF